MAQDNLEDGFPELPEWWFDDPISPYSITLGGSQNYGHGQVIPYLYIEFGEGEVINKTALESKYASLLERNSRKDNIDKGGKTGKSGFSALQEDS